MLLVVVIQSAVFSGTVLGTNVAGTLTENSFSIFATTVESRKSYLETEMLNRWSSIEPYKKQVEDIYNSVHIQSTDMSEEEKGEFLAESLNTVVDMMVYTETTGGFLILDDGIPKEISNSCLYLLSDNPTLSDIDSGNLQLLNGPDNIIDGTRISLASQWSYGYMLDESTAHILQQPVDAMKTVSEARHAARWNVNKSHALDGQSTLTYTMPLLDADGNPFGVIGVEINQSQLYKVMPFDEMTLEEEYGYFLAMHDGDSFVPIMNQGTIQNSIIPLNTRIEDISVESERYNCYTIPTVLGYMVVTLTPLSLYDSNTPFEEDVIYLGNIASRQSLYDNAESLIFSIIVALIVSLLIGAIAAYNISKFFTYPIVRLNNTVSSKQPDELANIPHLGITEIDQLSDSIVNLYKNAVDSASKTDKILHMMNLGVGSFEYNTKTKSVKVSSTLCQMLDFLPIDFKTLTLSDDVFLDFWTDIKTRPEEGVADTFRVSDTRDQWLRIIVSYKDDGVLGVITDVTKDVLERRALNYERDYDLLTGLNNRLAFHRKVGAIMAGQRLNVAAIAMFDLDNLKYVNDTFGHDLGDVYIKSAARIINTSFTKNAVTGRMSGDEFFIFFYDFTDKNTVLLEIERLYEALDNEPILLPDGNEFKIRMSGGLSWHGEDSVDLAELIRFADFAMYEGKHTLKGELHIFNKKRYEEESFMLSGKEELNRILDNQFVEFHFQPIIKADGTIYAYEALMRPMSEVLNNPAKLLQIAKAQSQLWKIERLTFYKSMSTYVKHKAMFGDAKLFINSVPNQVLKPNEYDDFERMYKDELHNLVVEIIETEQLDVSSFERKLERVKVWGASIALDDYGSGYNNDLNLLKIQPNIVKIDRSIITAVETDESRQAIVAKAISFCKERDILVLAEGVETDVQLKYLIEAGIDLIQGYYVSRPGPLPDYNPDKVKAEILSYTQ